MSDFDEWWRVNRIAAHQIKNAGGFARTVWDAAIRSIGPARRSRTPAYDLSREREHVCMFCGASEFCTTIQADKAGWDWYTGLSGGLKCVCGKCCVTRAEEWRKQVIDMQRAQPAPAAQGEK